MKALEFIDLVVPRGGTYCIVGINPVTKIPTQRFTSDLNEVQKYLDSINQDTTNTYFALSSFKDGSSRKQSNVQEIKSFFLDIDISDDPEKVASKKAYADKALALNIASNFINENGLPLPMVVDSGGGWHLYWVLDTAMSVEQWQPIAEMFKQLCIQSDLHIDPAVPADSARVLRVVGTNNIKYGVDANLLTGIAIPDPIPLTQFESPLRDACKALGITARAPKAKTVHIPLDEATKQLLGYKDSKFSTIAKRSLLGDGCMQIKEMLVNPNGVSYDMWCNGLAVANRCVDGETAIHKLSKGHNDYNEQATIEKSAEFTGGRRCDRFIIDNPDGCKGCKHQGNIGSPIQLGIFVPESTATQILLDAPITHNGAEPVVEAPIKINIPKINSPFYRGINGGIYTHGKPAEGAEGATEDILVYAHDLFVMKRIKDGDSGEVILFNLILPMDGLIEFVLPLTHVCSPDKLREGLAFHGITAGKKRMELIMAYIMNANEALQKHVKLELSRTQFGWHDSDTVFVLGKREISATGMRYSPPSVATSALAPHMDPKGSYEIWKTVGETLSRPGWERHQIAALVAFGSPIMKFTGEHGLLINCINKDSGTGKTLVQHWVNSVYGNTTHMMMRKSDTIAAKTHQTGVLCHLPVCTDEITNMVALDLSDLAYGFAEGRGRQRMESGANKLRVNNTFWSTIGLASANASMADKITVSKSTAEGELMRIFELEFTKPEELDADYAQSIVSQLSQNYGHAGELYIKSIVAELPHVKALLAKVKKKINKLLKSQSKERMWVAAFSAMITGGYIARQLGIINWDIEKLTTLLIQLAIGKRQEVSDEQLDFGGVLGDFLSENKGAILQINGIKDARSGLSNAPIFNPNVRIVARVEPDTKRLYIVRSVFKDYCVKRQIPFTESLAGNIEGVKFLGIEKLRIMRGTGIDAPAAPTLKFEGVFEIEAEHE
jgi:hypothetical protein